MREALLLAELLEKHPRVAEHVRLTIESSLRECAADCFSMAARIVATEEPPIAREALLRLAAEADKKVFNGYGLVGA